MTITKAHAQMLATLACDSRPTGARRWTPDEVMAEIAKLHDRSLPVVVCAVIRAAADRGAQRPSVIASAGSHWTDAAVVSDPTPNRLDAGERCSVCSMSKTACRIRHSTDDHEFESVAEAAKRRAEANPEAVAGAVAALKDEIHHVEPRDPAPRGLEALADRDLKLKARVDALRAANPGVASPPLQEPTNPQPGAVTAKPETSEEMA